MITIVLAVVGAWLLASVLLALAIGRAVRIADRRQRKAMAAVRPVRPVRVERPEKVPVHA